MRWTLEHGMMVRRFGAGPELVWLHGLGEWSQTFDTVAAHPALAGFSHVLPDLPGYGRSPWPEDGDLHEGAHDARDVGGDASDGDDGRDAPGGDGRDAPGGDGRDAPGGDGRDAPGGDGRDAPGGDGRDAPGGDGRDAPGGDGRDAPGGDGRALGALADRLVGWLGDRRPALIGASMGGVLATMIAERAAVRAVVNIDGNISLGDCTFSGKAAAYAIDDFAASGFAALRADVYDAGRTDLALRGYHAALSAASPRVFHRHAGELVAMSRSEQLAPRLAALRAPALFVAGIPGGICERSRALLDRHAVRWIGLEPAGHWVHRDQPDAFAAAAAAFLRDT